MFRLLSIMTKSNLRIWNLKYIVTFFGHNSYLPLLKFCTLHSIFCNFNSELTAINIYGLNCVHFYDPFYCQIAIKRKYWSVERLVNYISFFKENQTFKQKSITWQQFKNVQILVSRSAHLFCILRILNILFVYFLSIFSRQKF